LDGRLFSTAFLSLVDDVADSRKARGKKVTGPILRRPNSETFSSADRLPVAVSDTLPQLVARLQFLETQLVFGTVIAAF
jgi:hypothetical protein